jgi:hypothetical protein
MTQQISVHRRGPQPIRNRRQLVGSMLDAKPVQSENVRCTIIPFVRHKLVMTTSGEHHNQNQEQEAQEPPAAEVPGVSCSRRVAQNRLPLKTISLTVVADYPTPLPVLPGEVELLERFMRGIIDAIFTNEQPNPQS